MKIAFDKVDITPDKPCFMAGYGRDKKSIAALDPIEINSIAYMMNEQLFVIGILDSIILEEKFCDTLREKTAVRLGINPMQVTISAIHTHSAPAFFKLFFEDTLIEPELRDKAGNVLTDSMVRAAGNLQECEVKLEVVNIDGLYGNRNIKGGSEDKHFYVFSFYNKESKRLGCLCNISAHPTILNGSSYLLSADLLGQIRLRLQKQYDCPIAITNGACGDVSTRFYRKYSGQDELYYIADEIMDQFNKNKKSIKLNGHEVKAAELTYTTHFDEHTDEIWKEIANKMEAQKSLPLYKTYQDHRQRRIAASPFDLRMIAQLRLFGNVMFVILPGDVLSTFGLKIKAAFPQINVILICYSNTYCNYLVPKEEYGKYFESFNTRLAFNEADRFIDKVIQRGLDLIKND